MRAVDPKQMEWMAPAPGVEAPREKRGVAAQLNHTIVWVSDQAKSALFLAEMSGRPRRQPALAISTLWNSTMGFRSTLPTLMGLSDHNTMPF